MEKVRKYNWCYTLNIKEKEDPDINYDSMTMKYKCSQLESAPTTGQLHYQGFISFKKQYRLNWLKENVSNQAHFEPCKGTPYENRIYCSKPGGSGFKEYGNIELCGQGARTDLKSIFSMVKSGAKIVDVMESDPLTYSKYQKGIKDYQFECERIKAKDWRDVQSYVYYGETGTGKTKAAKSGGDFFLLSPPASNGAVWFDGYGGESTLIIDDFYGWIMQHTLLRYMDGHPLIVQIKGGHVWAKWTTVIFTSNQCPDQWYKNGLTDAFKRRCPEVNWIYYGDLEINTNNDQFVPNILK